MIRYLLRRIVSDHYISGNKLKYMPGSYFPNQGKVHKEESRFGPTPIYPGHDIEEPTKDLRQVERNRSLLECFALGASQLKMKIKQTEGEFKRKEREASRSSKKHPIDVVIEVLSSKTEEEKLAFSKYAAEARLSDDPNIRTKGFYIEYALQRVEEIWKKENKKETREDKIYWSKIKEKFTSLKSARKEGKKEMVKVDKSFLDEKVKNFFYIREMINRHGMLIVNDVYMEKIIKVRKELKNMQRRLMSILDPHEALVYKEIFKKDLFPSAGRLILTDENLLGKETAEALEKKKRIALFDAHKKLTTGITPLELIKKDYDKSDILGNRLKKEADSLAIKFQSAREKFYKDAINNKYELKEISKEIEGMYKQKEEKIPSDLPPKVNEYYTMSEVCDILSDFVREEVGKGRSPPVISNIIPGKTFTNDFGKWSRALGLEPIMASKVNIKHIDPFHSRPHNMETQKMREEDEYSEEEAMKRAKEEIHQPLDKYERYELEVYKGMKRDKYFDHYLDNVLKRRDDNMVQAAANFGINSKTMVRGAWNI